MIGKRGFEGPGTGRSSPGGRGLRALPAKEGGPHLSDQTGKYDVREEAVKREDRNRSNLIPLQGDLLPEVLPLPPYFRVLP